MTSCYILLNSRDRNTATSRPNTMVAEQQPWNDFRLTKPSAYVENSVKKLGVTEVYFPWAIPNVTERNNKFYMSVSDTPLVGTPDDPGLIEIPVGFYDGESLASAIQEAMDAEEAEWGVTPPTIEWDDVSQSFTITPALNTFFMIQADTEDGSLAETNFYRKPSLCRTMGFTIEQCAGTAYKYDDDEKQVLTSGPTSLLYTSYVDIVSDQLHSVAEVSDSSSTFPQSISDVLCRLYCADENSDHNTKGQAPFTIHRQFAKPKWIHWSTDRTLNGINIKVYDEYGELVYLAKAPTDYVNSGGIYLPQGYTQLAYPDFCLTLEGKL